MVKHVLIRYIFILSVISCLTIKQFCILKKLKNPIHKIKIDREFRRKMDLLWLLTKKEITLKYRRTTLGILWSLLNPILLSIVFFIAFKIFMKFNMENYHFFLLSALFPWNWFAASVTMATQTITSNINLIRRIRFPIHFLIIATVLAQLVNFLFALLIITGLAYFYGVGPGISWFIGIPILIASQLIVTTGVSLAISTLNAYFRDMEHIVGVVVNMFFWMTPIVYPLDAISDTGRRYLILNPLTYLMTAWREIFMANTIDWSNVGISFGSSIVFFLFGAVIFKKLKKRLDERL